MQEGRDAPAPALLTQCGSLGASTKSSARSFTSWLSSVSLYLHNFFFTPQQPEYYTWNFHPGASYVCQSLCTYWGNWVWPVLGSPQSSTSYCRKCWILVCLSLPRTGALFFEDNPYPALSLWLSPWDVLAWSCFFHHSGCAGTCRVDRRWHLSPFSAWIYFCILWTGLFFFYLPSKYQRKLEEWQRCEKSPREDWF